MRWSHVRVGPVIPLKAGSAPLCGSEQDCLIVLLDGRVYAQANAEEPGSYTLMLANEYWSSLSP